MNLPESAEILKAIFQLDALQRSINPHLPTIGRKIVSDMIKTGTPPRAIAKAIKRSPSYVRAVANGEKSLNANSIVAVLKLAAQEVSRDAGK